MIVLDPRFETSEAARCASGRVEKRPKTAEPAPVIAA
jgi:hypothetical protein